MSALYDELTTGPLANELSTIIAADDFVAIMDVFYRKDIPVLGNLSVHNVKEYVSLLGLRLPILDATAQSCREFNTALEDFKDSGFDLSNSIIYTKIEAVLDALVAETLIPDFTEEHKLTLLSLGNALISRAEQLGYEISQQAIVDAIYDRATGQRLI